MSSDSSRPFLGCTNYDGVVVFNKNYCHEGPRTRKRVKTNTIIKNNARSYTLHKGHNYYATKNHTKHTQKQIHKRKQRQKRKIVAAYPTINNMPSSNNIPNS